MGKEELKNVFNNAMEQCSDVVDLVDSDENKDMPQDVSEDKPLSPKAIKPFVLRPPPGLEKKT